MQLRQPRARSFWSAALSANKLFFIYVAKNKDLQQMQAEDWDYVSSMARFYKWWVKRYLGTDIPVEADILPIIPGKLFDRMGIGYLERDHDERDPNTYHVYLSYHKPLWTDCNTEGYSGDRFSIAWWKRPEEKVSETERLAMYAGENCPRVSHMLAHEFLRWKGKSKQDYFSKIHDLWDKHEYKDLPYLYFDSHFKRVRKDGPFKFATIDLDEL